MTVCAMVREPWQTVAVRNRGAGPRGSWCGLPRNRTVGWLGGSMFAKTRNRTMAVRCCLCEPPRFVDPCSTLGSSGINFHYGQRCLLYSLIGLVVHSHYSSYKGVRHPLFLSWGSFFRFSIACYSRYSRTSGGF